MTEKTRIGVVIPKYGLVGGGERFVYELTERLAQDSSFKVHVFANKWRSKSTRVTFHHIPIIKFPRFFSVLSFAWFAQKKIADVGIDVIHTHERIFSADIFTLHGIPHRLWIKTIRKKGMSLFDRCYAYIECRLVEDSRCRYFLPVSTITRDAFLSAYDCTGKHTEIMYPGIDLDRFASCSKSTSRDTIRKKYGFLPSDKVILFVSMNFEIKGLDHLMAGVSIAKQHHSGKPLRLLVVGKGNAGKYRRLARDLGIADDVIFAGVLDRGIEQLYASCDIFAMLSRFDTFGLTVLEAMAASLPVLVSHQVGAKDIVRPDENGYVVDRKNPAVVAQYLLLLANEEKLREMGGLAYQTASQHRWDNSVEQMKIIYRKVYSTDAN